MSAIPEDRDDDDSACALEQYAEQITDLKAELKDAQSCMLNLELKIPSYALRMKSSKPFFDVLWPLGRDFLPRLMPLPITCPRQGLLVLSFLS